MNTQSNIVTEVNRIIGTYREEEIELAEGLLYNQYQTLRMIDFYSNSRYLLGQKDELGREKPFRNIGNAICDVEDAAKDIDTKDITITSDLPQDFDKSWLLSIEVYEWMKEADFAQVLNDIRSTHTRYGGVLVKKCYEEEDEDGKMTSELKIEVCKWKNLVTDQINIEDGAIIEKHYMSPSNLAKKQDVWDNVEEAMKLATKARVMVGTQVANANTTTKRVPVYEVRGEFPVSYFKEVNNKKTTQKDENTYSYQCYIIAGEQGGKQVVLYSENDAERVYKFLARKEKAGRALGMGVIEENEQAQIWTNDAVQKQQRALEYTSKVIGQSASKKLKGRNMMTQVDNGQILEHEDGKPITSLQLMPAGGLAQFDNLIQQWYTHAEQTSSAYAAQRGETPPSGTPFRLQAQVLQQSSSVFDDLREDMGIFIGEIFEDWVLPYLAKKLTKAHILSHEFSSSELKALDNSFATHQANKDIIEKVLSGVIVTQEDYDKVYSESKDRIATSKSRRFFDIPKGYYKDIAAKVTVNTTGEQRNKAAALESLNNIMMTIAKNPQLLQDPVASQIFTKIVELSGAGISPFTLMSGIEEQAKQAKAQQALQGPQMAQGAPGMPQAAQTPQPQELSLQANPQ